MENEIQNKENEEAETRLSDKSNLIPASIIVAGALMAGAWVYTASPRTYSSPKNNTASVEQVHQKTSTGGKIFPSGGVVLPVRWGDLGARMASTGVIDVQKFESLYAERGGLDDEMKKMLNGADNGNLRLTEENSGIVLNMLWALGLGTKSDILEAGPMVTYSGRASPADLSAGTSVEEEALAKAGNFASTGGWTIAEGGAMDHYSRHPLIDLTPDQQKLVERVSKNIYRPCCGNSTYFPDCNHGMAMLGLLELMSSQDIPEKDMYRAALWANIYWFPEQYLIIAKYFEGRGISWDRVDPKEVLSAAYSSSAGFQKISTEVNARPGSGGAPCGAEAGLPAGEAGSSAPQERSSGGCGI